MNIASINLYIRVSLLISCIALAALPSLALADCPPNCGEKQEDGGKKGD